MITGIASIFLFVLGFANQEPGLMIASSIFALASNVGWLGYFLRSIFRKKK